MHGLQVPEEDPGMTFAALPLTGVPEIDWAAHQRLTSLPANVVSGGAQGACCSVFEHGCWCVVCDEQPPAHTGTAVNQAQHAQHASTAGCTRTMSWAAPTDTCPSPLAPVAAAPQVSGPNTNRRRARISFSSNFALQPNGTPSPTSPG